MDVTTSLWITESFPTLNWLDGPKAGDDLATSERVPEMLFGTKVGAGQQQESRKECPEHQARAGTLPLGSTQ
jgi:hypothetical protein